MPTTLPSTTDAFLKSAKVRIKLAGFDEFSVSLDPREPSHVTPLVQALRPRVTVEAAGQNLGSVQPFGDPDHGAPWGLILAGGLAALVWSMVKVIK